jgi:hypothetical protein
MPVSSPKQIVIAIGLCQEWQEQLAERAGLSPNEYEMRFYPFDQALDRELANMSPAAVIVANRPKELPKWFIARIQTYADVFYNAKIIAAAPELQYRLAGGWSHGYILKPSIDLLADILKIVLAERLAGI